jgi:aerobic-type carbon monoxide dehydrogenase small subunit (CoxS/CutS family)
MKLSKQEKNEARKGCHFFHNGYCLCDINGKTFCACLKVVRDAKKAKPSKGITE